jgi:hypothetical protein
MPYKGLTQGSPTRDPTGSITRPAVTCRLCTCHKNYTIPWVDFPRTTSGAVPDMGVTLGHSKVRSP